MSLETSDTTVATPIPGWKQKDLPHKGWELRDVFDSNDDSDEDLNQECEFCFTPIRYCHMISHPSVEKEYQVGVVFAENLTQDYSCHKREKALKSKSSKIKRWVKSPKWIERWSDGHMQYLYRSYKSHSIYLRIVFGGILVVIDDQVGRKSFKTVEAAKIASLKGVWYLNERAAALNGL